MEEAEAKRIEQRVCKICYLSDTNEYEYGEWKTSENYTVHYFCALLSSDAKQQGKDDEGIYGFLVNDLREMCRSYTKTRCAYCSRTRATVTCCEPKCFRRFHMVCGIKNKCLNEFVDPFRSFCDRHVQIEEKPYKHAPDSICRICFEALGEYDAFTSIPACCVHDNVIDYYHKACIQKYAAKFGALAKCPCCGNDADGYRKFLSLRGIFCPEKDADYELSKDAYASLLYKHRRCDAEECHCPKGRNHIGSRGDWMYYCCQYCGSVGTHAKCRTDDSTESFSCRDCTEKQSQGVQLSLFKNINGNADKVNNSNTNSCGRKHKFDAEGEGKVWKKVHISEPFKRTTYDLMDLNDNSDIDSHKQKKNFRNDRLQSFLANSDFSSKPRPPPWLL